MGLIDVWAIAISAISIVVGGGVVTLLIGYVEPWNRDYQIPIESISTTQAIIILAGILLVGTVIILETELIRIPIESTIVLRRLIQEYGYVAFFIIFVIEGAMLLYFAPSESLVPVAIVLMADSMWDYALIIGLAIVGATLGQTALFLSAKYAGREYLLEKKWFTTTEETLDRFDEWFQRRGPVVIPLSNTLLFTRGLLTVPAGLAKMNTAKFAILSAIGTLSFETILAAITIGLLEIL